ncbi:MAG: flagellar M-ring protein FliF, partial [Pacificibacter sp.]
ALVALVLGLFVVRPIFATAPAALPAPALGLAAPEAPQTLQAAQTNTAALAQIGTSEPALTGEIESGEFNLPTLGVASDFDAEGGAREASADPVTRLKALIEERQEETVEILRGWMDQKAEDVL